MKLQLDIHDAKYTYEHPDDHANITDIVEAFRGMLVTAGFHPMTIEALFDETAIEPWNLAQDNCDNKGL